MRVAAFVYDFPHEKSVQGLLHLSLVAPSEVLVLAAPRVSLPRRAERTSLAAVDPRRIAERQGFRYEVGPHEASAPVLEAFQPAFAFVFGARVLPPPVTSIGIPIVNLHPGVLPDNRGLDAAAWAVLHDVPQGVSAHLVSQRIDGGSVLGVSVLPQQSLLSCSSLADVRSAVTELELRVLRELLLSLGGQIGAGVELAEADLGPYHSSLTEQQHQDAEAQLPSYVHAYSDFVSVWRSRWAPLCDMLPPELRPDVIA